MNKKSIAFQLGIYVLTAVILVNALIVFLNYKHSRDILSEKIEEGAIHQSGLIINEISKKIVNDQEVSRNVANQALYYHAHGDLGKFIEQVVKHNRVMNGLHVRLIQSTDTLLFSSYRNSKGQVDNLQTPKNNSITRFPNLVDSTATTYRGIWSQPFYSAYDSTKLQVSYFLPIPSNDSTMQGIIAGDINLGFLSQAVSNIRIGVSGFAFIVNKNGDFLSHPNPSWILNKNLFHLESKIFDTQHGYYEQLLENGIPGSGTAFPEILNYQKSWFYFAPIPHTEWRVIVVIPTKELYDELDVAFQEIVWISLLGILLTSLIIVLIFNKMLSPLAQVARSIQRFSFGERGRRSKKNEIELLNDSLKELQVQYGTYMKEQNQIRKDKRKYEKDLKSAKEIQRTIVPQDYSFLEKHGEIDLHAILQPAEGIGGDLYDFFFIDEKHLLFTIGDVSGKGIPAALFMAVASTLIKTKSNGLSAMKIVDVVNKALSKENLNQHFLTLFLGVLNLETGVLDYCNAAHSYPFLISSKKRAVLLEQTHGLPIGFYSNKTYKSSSIILSKNDQLVFYTDGVTDCKDASGEMFGMPRLREFMDSYGTHSPKELTESLLDELMDFKGKAPQADDISVMAIKFNGKYP